MLRAETPIFPEVTGTEEETHVTAYDGLTTIGGEVLFTWTSEHTQTLFDCIDSDCALLPGSNEFRENGTRMYPDCRGDVIETTTAESDTPLVQVTGMRANAQLLSQGMERYAVQLARAYDHPVTLVQQRRVRDSRLAKWGVHDNFSITHNNLDVLQNDELRLNRLLGNHLKTRNVITGAGIIDKRGAYFSQKLVHAAEFNPHLGNNDWFKFKSEHSEWPRIEIRCNDVNLIDAAALSRIGGTALVLATAQTDLAEKIVEVADRYLSGTLTRYNSISLTPSGHFEEPDIQQQAIDFQRASLETILEEFHLHSWEPIPNTYSKIATSIIDFCDDASRVIHNKDSLELIADRADWAAKLLLIRTDTARKAPDRPIYDIRNRAIDLLYDRIVVTAYPSGKTEVRKSLGQRRADKYRLTSEVEVEHAMKHPPQKTRAAVRVQTLQDLGPRASSCGWDHVVIDLESSDPKIDSSVEYFGPLLARTA